ncbi:protein disulfide-isomerase precursor [Neonectria magnoliae]|uniref:Protein disulfide-isomerase n=1 Tax=Neonectria magnoliae TaxID=2732573 RepID=A0ABR1HBH8_9HYPO
MTLSDIENKAAPGVPYFTPAQEPPAGSALDPASAPTLFKPLRIRGVTLHNRFVVSPMCTYSARDGHLSDWHLVHLGQFALHGASLVTVEATAVEPRGRISPNDSGLWEDGQIAPLKRITDFIHSQNSKVSIQLAHAGRKASTLPPWIGGSVNKALAPASVGGWVDDVVGPSAIPFAEDHAQPHELTVEDIKGLVQSFVDSAVRAVKAGVDVIEIHGAHGYLHTNFLSPTSNKRTDQYGGSFENRTRFLTETIQAVRAVIPEEMPLWLRVSGTEWVEYAGEPSWDINETICLAKLLPALGVDVLDVSSGGNNEQQKIKVTQSFQTDLARQVRTAVRAEGLDLLIAAVGVITESQFAKSVVQEDQEPSADLVQAARQFLREPNWVLKVAHELDVPVQWAHQYHRAPPKPKSRSQL